MVRSPLGWLQNDTILSAHNARSFDMRVFLLAVQQSIILKEAERTITSFIDSLAVLRDVRPKEGSHSLGALYNRIMGMIMTDVHESPATMLWQT